MSIGKDKKFGTANLNAPVETISKHRADLEKVQRLVSRDPEAWAEFVQQFQIPIQRRIETTARECRFVLDRADIEDIGADVFRALVANEMSCLKSFRGISSLAGWLMVIVRRTCLQYLSKRPRDRGRGATLEDSNTYQFDFESRERDIALELIKNEEASTLKSTISGLRPADQKVLHLYFVEEKSYQEIGAKMGISTNAVGPKLHRAQQRLKKLIRGNEHDT